MPIVTRENSYVPEEGTYRDFFERLEKYISIYDDKWVDRIKPGDEKLLKDIERLSQNKVPKIYREFVKYMGGNDGGLLEHVLGYGTMDIKDLIELYEDRIIYHPELEEQNKLIGFFHDELIAFEVSLDVTVNEINPPVYITSDFVISNEKRDFYSQSLEHLLFQSAFSRYERYKHDRVIFFNLY